jgi:hypothetical protein
MTEIRGKLLEGGSGVLRFKEGSVTLLKEKGLINKRLVETAEIEVSHAHSTSLTERQPPYRSMNRLTISYNGEDKDCEVSFFSDDRSGLKKVKGELDVEIKRLKDAWEREKAERRRERESHLHHITLVLELLDQIFLILLSLHDKPSWRTMVGSLEEAGRIINEMEDIGVIAPLNIDIRGLSTAVSQRRIDEIKEEAYAILSVLHRDSERLAKFEGTDAFDLELHELFVKSYLLLWDLYMTDYIGENRGEGESETFSTLIERLTGNIGDPQCTKGLRQAGTKVLTDGMDPYFDRLRLGFHLCLENLVEGSALSRPDQLE